MDDPDGPVGKKELLLRYLKSKMDPLYTNKIALGKIIKKFIDEGRDEIKIKARQEIYPMEVQWRYYIDGELHPLFDLLTFKIVTTGKEYKDFTKDTDGVDYVKTHICCLTEYDRHLVMVHCHRCNSKRMGSPELRYCGSCIAPLYEYLMSLDVIVTAREILPADPNRDLKDEPLNIEITISWKHWEKEIKKHTTIDEDFEKAYPIKSGFK